MVFVGGFKAPADPLRAVVSTLLCMRCTCRKPSTVLPGTENEHDGVTLGEDEKR